MGINPDIIIVRVDSHMPDEVREKIALFCNVDTECCIENFTLPVLYSCPAMLEESNFSSIVCKRLNLDPRTIDMSEWQSMLKRISARDKTVKIALCGKYVQLHDAYLSVAEALAHGGYENGAKVDIEWIDSEALTESNISKVLDGVLGIIVPGGFGERGIEGMVLCAKYARERNIPYLGICLGMQVAVVEYARNVLGYKDANSAEFDSSSKHCVIDLIPDMKSKQMGGSMRLGAYKCKVKDGLIKKCYGTDEIFERHRHRYTVNKEFIGEIERAGMKITCLSADGNIVEGVEIPANKFFVGVQFHPEFKSRPQSAHPIFRAFIKAVLNEVK